MAERWIFYGTPVQFGNAVLSYWNLKTPRIPCKIDERESNSDQVTILVSRQAGLVWIIAHTIPGGKCKLIIVPQSPDNWDAKWWGEQWDELVAELQGQGWRIEADMAAPNEALKDWLAQKRLEDREREPEMLKFLAESRNRFSVEEIERAVVNSLSRLSPQQFTLKKVLDGPPVIIYDVTYHGELKDVEGKTGVYGRYRIEQMKDGTVKHYFESSYSPLWDVVNKMVYVELRDRGVLKTVVTEQDKSAEGYDKKTVAPTENMPQQDPKLVINIFAGGDIVGGDKTTVGNISDSTGIAVGTGASANKGAEPEDGETVVTGQDKSVGKYGNTAVPTPNDPPTSEELKYQSELLQFLKRHFNDGELKTLYFDLGWEYGQFEAGGKDVQALALVRECFKTGRQNELVDWMARHRPNAEMPKPPG